MVTAEFRRTNLQTTPVAVTAIDSRTIEDMAPRTLAGLAQLVPNFSVNKINGFNAASFAMRGVGNTDIIVYNSPPVAVLLDDETAAVDVKMSLPPTMSTTDDILHLGFGDGLRHREPSCCTLVIADVTVVFNSSKERTAASGRTATR